VSLVVTEYVPNQRLAWATTADGDETGSSAYHGWVERFARAAEAAAAKKAG
jgi:hypothetical protein